MKPFAEQMETSGMNSSDGEHENLQWRLSITNVPCRACGSWSSKVIVLAHTPGVTPRKIE